MQAISPCCFSNSAGNAVAVVAPGRAWAIDCRRRGVWHGSLAEVVWHVVWQVPLGIMVSDVALGRLSGVPLHLRDSRHFLEKRLELL